MEQLMIPDLEVINPLNARQKWPMVKLGDICSSFQNGIGKGKEYYGKGTKIANIGDLYESPRFSPIKYSLLDCDNREIEKYKLSCGDLLFVRSSLKREGVAYCSAFDSNEECLFSSFMIRAVCDQSKVSPVFLAYQLRSPFGRSQLLANSNTATITNIGQDGLKETLVFLPPPDEQQQIVARLDLAQRLIDQRKAQLALMDQLVQALFYEMFGDPVKNEKGWKLVSLPYICAKQKYSLKRGPFGGALKKEIFVQAGIKVYEQKNAIQKNALLGSYFISEPKYNELKAFTVQPGDFIVSCSGTMGEIYRLPHGAPIGIINQALMKIAIESKLISPTFFESIFKYYIKEHILISSSKGSGLQNIASMDTIKSNTFILPPLPVQQAFADRVHQIEALKQQMQVSLAELEQNFQALMQEAFGG